jgi:hypothetical protein
VVNNGLGNAGGCGNGPSVLGHKTKRLNLFQCPSRIRFYEHDSVPICPMNTVLLKDINLF